MTPPFQSFLGATSIIEVDLSINGVPFVPTVNDALILTAKRALTDSDNLAEFQVASGAGITVSGSVATIKIVSAATELIDPGGLYVDIRATHALTGDSFIVSRFRWQWDRPASRDVLTSIPVFTTETPLPIGGNSASNTPYGPSWNGITDVPPSQNAVWDKIETLAPLESPTFTGTVTATTYQATDTNGIEIKNSAGISIVRVGEDFTGIGKYKTGISHGFGGIASGNYSHTEGGDTTASGDYSHAEGANSIASAEFSHCEGANSVASGYCSHAEGYQTNATNSYSHSEGYLTTSNGTGAHAEGKSTTASGFYSHAEGENSVASGLVSHADGQNSTASGIRSNASGRKAKAVHDGSRVMTDSQDADCESTAANQCTLRYANGYRFLGGAADFATTPTVAGVPMGSPTTASILTALGVPTYANLTEANTALTIGKPFYNTALTKLDITTA